MVTFSELQKRLKTATDSILPGFKGKIEAGGTINHRIKMGENTITFNQNMLNYKTSFSICCSYFISNDYFRYHKNRIFKMETTADRYIVLPLDFTFNKSAWFDIKDDADIEKWIGFTSRKAPENLVKAKEYASLERQEEIVNNPLLHVLEKKEGLDTNDIINGLIYAKLANKQYFEKIYADAKTLMIQLGFADINIVWLDDAYSYLKNKTKQELFNL